MTDNELSPVEARRAQAIRQINVGEFLQQQRKAKRLTLAEVASAVGISPTYLSDIEHGRKLPSDIAIREIAEYYGIDEVDLFTQFGKIPLTVKDELRDNVWLQRTLTDIRKSKKLTDDEKQTFYDGVQQMYKDMLREEQ